MNELLNKLNLLSKNKKYKSRLKNEEISKISTLITKKVNDELKPYELLGTEVPSLRLNCSSTTYNRYILYHIKKLI
jgi:hypothetical protein